MSKYQLETGLFLYPTPAGAYYAISSGENDKSRQFLKNLLRQKQTPALTVENLLQLMDSDNDERCLELLHHCQQLGWVQGITETLPYPQGALETILPGLLDKVSQTGKALLADNQGFYLACNGFPHEVAEELSGLSAEIASVHLRRFGVLIANLGVGSSAWAVVDAAGNSRIGFWPINIGEQRFFIVISGPPNFNQPEFVSLIWALSVRYAKSGEAKHA